VLERCVKLHSFSFHFFFNVGYLCDLHAAQETKK